jgi:hypothetical protein
MANGTRTLTLLVVLIVGIAVGWFIGQGQTRPTTPTPTPVPTASVPMPAATPVVHPVVTPPGSYPPADNWTLTVGPTACDTPAGGVTQNGKPVPVAVIKRGFHWIRFTPNAGQELGIVFHVEPNCPKPFKNMALAGYDSQGYAHWALVCDQPNNSCFTGLSDKNACPTYYKIDQTLGGKTCDAGIIIQP